MFAHIPIHSDSIIRKCNLRDLNFTELENLMYSKFGSWSFKIKAFPGWFSQIARQWHSGAESPCIILSEEDTVTAGGWRGEVTPHVQESREDRNKP